MSDLYIVVCKNDIPHPKYGADPGGEIILEVYTKDATEANALRACETFKAHGKCRIARLVFEKKPSVWQRFMSYAMGEK
jgi:hypothetical protein